MNDERRVALATGVTLNVVTAGAEDAPPVSLLHGFPESHRTWRHVAPRLERDFRLIMPDQRGFGASDQPPEVEAYRPDVLIADIFALADALGVERFHLVGHDWGGAIAWPAALARPERLLSLSVVNAPHPWVFQQTILENPAQRAASQYISAFRSPGIEAMIAARGFDGLFERTFAGHVDLSRIDENERARYIADWSRPGALHAMLNWYRATGVVVPPPGETIERPRWMKRFPKLNVPTLVVWGMRDPALLPVQLDGLSDWVEDLTIECLPDAGHFAPWEAQQEVASALAAFLKRH